MISSALFALWSRYILWVKSLMINLVSNHTTSNHKLKGIQRMDMERAKSNGL